MVVRTLARACAVFVVALVMTSPAAAQDGVPLSGRLLNSLNGTPLGGATVQIDELRRQTMSAADGTFTFENVPPGTYHLSVTRAGFLDASHRGQRRCRRCRRSSCRSTSICISRRSSPSAGDARSQFDTFQPTSVLAGQELVEATRDVAGRDARKSAWRCVEEFRSRAGAPGHSRTRWRSRADPAGRPAPGRSLEPVRRSRSADQSCGGAEDRGRARSGDAALRRQRDWRPGQRHHRRDSHQTADGRQRQLHVRPGIGGERRRAAR